MNIIYAMQGLRDDWRTLEQYYCDIFGRQTDWFSSRNVWKEGRTSCFSVTILSNVLVRLFSISSKQRYFDVSQKHRLECERGGGRRPGRDGTPALRCKFCGCRPAGCSLQGSADRCMQCSPGAAQYHPVVTCFRLMRHLLTRSLQGSC